MTDLDPFAPAGGVASPPPDLGALLRQAVTHHRSGQLEDAEVLYRQVLAADPNNADALHLLGVVAYQVQNFPAALELIAEAIRNDERQPAFHNNFGNVLRDQGFLDEALIAYCSAITLDNDFAEAHTNLGLVLHAKGKTEEALIRHQKAIAIQPDYAEAHFNLGRALKDLDRQEAATEAFRQAIALKPSMAAAHNNLGNLIQQQGLREEAEGCYRRALEINSEDPDAHNNLGSLYLTGNRLDEAASCFERAMKIRPEYSDAWSNLGATRQKQGRIEEALTTFRQAIEIAPSSAEAHWNLSLLLLLRGEFEEGWKEYEWRTQRRAAAKSEHHLTAPLWAGDDLAGRTILLHAEQGLGDTLQFVRYAPLVARRGGRVILECQPELQNLMSELSEVAEVRTAGDRLPHFDCQAPLMSLPRIFGTRLETIPADLPYLAAPRAARMRWAERLAKESAGLEGYKVGLVWAGSTGHANDANRSIAPERLGPLLAAEGVGFVSLQVGPRAGELPAAGSGAGLGAGVLDLSAELTDFTETAAAVENLDLVITVDTAVAHLAGALGRPTWLLLPFAPDFRWLLEREDSPWYPALRLFRQAEPGDWESVIARLAGELAAREGAGLGAHLRAETQ